MVNVSAESIKKTKENLRRNDFSFRVNSGAFGFSNITEVSIGIPFEYKGVKEIENAPMMITFRNDDKDLASCLLDTSGDRVVRLYNEDGRSLKGRYWLHKSGRVDEWRIRDNQLLPFANVSTIDRVTQLSKDAGNIWQGYLQGKYTINQSVVNQIRGQWNKTGQGGN